MDAVLVEAGRDGYAQLRMAPLAKRASVSLSTFYAEFGGKEALFLAAYEASAEALLSVLTEAASGLDDEDAIEAAVVAFLDWYATRPETARSLLVEVLAAGPGALAARAAVLDRFVTGLDVVVAGRVPRIALVALVATADEIARERVRLGRPDRLRDLEPELLALARQVLR